MVHLPEWDTVEALDPRDLQPLRDRLAEELDWLNAHRWTGGSAAWAWRLNLAYVNARIARLNRLTAKNLSSHGEAEGRRSVFADEPGAESIATV